MSHNDSPPPPNDSPFTAPTPHEFILLSVALQGIAKILLDHGSVAQANAPEANTSEIAYGSTYPSGREAFAFAKNARLRS